MSTLKAIFLMDREALQASGEVKYAGLLPGAVDNLPFVHGMK